MIRNIIKIKNISKAPRSIRPYKDRNVLITFAIGETKEIDVLQGTWEIQKNPTAYFKYLGFTVVTNGVPTVKPEPKKEERVVTPPPVQEPPKPVEPPKVKQTEPPVNEQREVVKLGADSGDFKHYNASSSQWQGLRKVRDWVVGRVIFDSVEGKYFQVVSLDGEQMICKPLKESEAVDITGTKAD